MSSFSSSSSVRKSRPPSLPPLGERIAAKRLIASMIDSSEDPDVGEIDYILSRLSKNGPIGGRSRSDKLPSLKPMDPPSKTTIYCERSMVEEGICNPPNINTDTILKMLQSEDHRIDTEDGAIDNIPNLIL